MAQPNDMITLDQPRIHLVHMMFFTLVVSALGAVLFPRIKLAFMANPGLNGLIGFVLLFGLIYSYRMVWAAVPGSKLGE